MAHLFTSALSVIAPTIALDPAYVAKANPERII